MSKQQKTKREVFVDKKLKECAQDFFKLGVEYFKYTDKEFQDEQDRLVQKYNIS